VNTVRTFMDLGFDASAKAILDDLYRNGIMVILTVDDGINDTARLKQAIAFYKDHPAVLMWMLGSEWNINYYFQPNKYGTVEEAAKATEEAAQLIKSLDQNHPIATSYGDIDILDWQRTLDDTRRYVNEVCPSVDIWALNVYRGDNFGSLFVDWAAITTKPMFLGEFGVDAFQSVAPAYPIHGSVNEEPQARWDLSLWLHLLRNLSAKDPSKVALGGSVFEWTDEWWKVSPGDPSVQEPGGWLSGAFPDGVGNEEYFGIVDIGRRPRQAYNVLRSAYQPNYIPPPQILVFRAVSRGYDVARQTGKNGFAEFHRANTQVGRAGGRGFNVLVIDPVTGDPQWPLRTFDTYNDPDEIPGGAWDAFAGHLEEIPSGDLVLIAVGDEAGLTDTECRPLPSRGSTSPRQRSLQALRVLGAAKIGVYCFRDSWVFAATKGQPQTSQEELGKGKEVSLVVSLPVP
jgi:hypothetical protein